jgi:hypothetical protein
MGFEKPITIEKVIKGIQANQYVLPAIQREFVWSAEQIEKLFDSLLKVPYRFLFVLAGSTRTLRGNFSSTGSWTAIMSVITGATSRSR